MDAGDALSWRPPLKIQPYVSRFAGLRGLLFFLGVSAGSAVGGLAFLFVVVSAGAVDSARFFF